MILERKLLKESYWDITDEEMNIYCKSRGWEMKKLNRIFETYFDFFENDINNKIIYDEAYYARKAYYEEG
jgi:hypothetical protein